MIVNCPNCKKKFDVEDNLIPSTGRLLQCSSCSNKWFFKKNKRKPKPQPKKNDSSNKNIEIPKETINIINEAEDDKDFKVNRNVQNYKISFFKIILIFIISFVAFVVLLDTFKSQINSILPGFTFFLDNFYLIIDDIFLFIKDLIRK